jgi:hypothetical protein
MEPLDRANSTQISLNVRPSVSLDAPGAWPPHGCYSGENVFLFRPVGLFCRGPILPKISSRPNVITRKSRRQLLRIEADNLRVRQRRSTIITARAAVSHLVASASAATCIDTSVAVARRRASRRALLRQFPRALLDPPRPPHNAVTVPPSRRDGRRCTLDCRTPLLPALALSKRLRTLVTQQGVRRGLRRG